MKTKIKPANKKDFKEITQIYCEEFSRPPYNEPWTLEKAIKKLETFSKYCDIWKITNNNLIVGFFVINTNWLCLGETIFGEEIAIKKEFQNKGIGTKAISFILNEYKKRGYKTLMAMENKNSKAKSLYNRLGITQSKENIFIEKELK